MNLRTLAFLVLAAFSAGCGNSATAPSTSTPFSELFTGTLSPGGSVFYSFTVQQTGAVNLTLASLTSSPLVVVPKTVGLALGVPVAEGCSYTTSITAGAALTAQISSTSGPGTLCVDVFDVGSLTGPINFAVVVTHF